MQIADLFKPRPMPILRQNGIEPVVVSVHEGEALAVHEVFHPERYSEVIHLHSGTALPARFSERLAAMRFCHDIAGLWDWGPLFDPRKLKHAQRRAVREAVDRQHGVWYPTKALSALTAPLFDASTAARRAIQ